MDNRYNQDPWQQNQNPQYQQPQYQQPQYQNPQYQQSQYQNQPYQQPQYQPGGYQPFNPKPVDDYKPIPMGQYVSKGEYRRKYTPKSFRKQIMIVSILCYVFAAINLVLAFVDPWGLVDVAIQLGLALGIHIAKSKGCAIAMIVYGAINVVLVLLSGSFGGWLWLAIGIGATVAINKVDKRYKEAIAGNMTGMY